jgi:hypothetical protein
MSKKSPKMFNKLVKTKSQLSINLTKPIMFSDFFSGEILHPSNEKRRGPV